MTFFPILILLPQEYKSLKRHFPSYFNKISEGNGYKILMN